MRLLIAIINDPRNVVDILDAFLENGIQGATVLESAGMAHLMADRVPFFSRFAELGEEEGRNKTIFVVLRSPEEVTHAVKSIEGVIGDLNRSDSGVVFTLPIDFCKGLNPVEETGQWT